MTRGWWRITNPDQVKQYIDSLHPRGVREKELSRMLTRFLDFAKESCLKVNEQNQTHKKIKVSTISSEPFVLKLQHLPILFFSPLKSLPRIRTRIAAVT